MLATGRQAANRLQLLDEIFGPESHEVLKRAGLAPGMRVTEVGCGTGLVALWMARVVGTNGFVAAVDLSSEQMLVARRDAAEAGLRNISFHVAGAYDTGLQRDGFDLVYSRFLMCHLAEPARALAEMRALLKPGGILVCEDHDDGGIFTEPPTWAYKRLVEISEAVNKSRGLDSYVGLKLPRLVHQAGFATPEVLVRQVVVLRGPAKSFWEITLREATPAILSAGASTSEELERICTEMQMIAQDDSTLLLLARVSQVWARK
ncbi:MAG TPA: methyltransferase domain-containing protein [Terriglobales bacterium]|nr:methyltransferase domain-containing protein [Terriglobales bacterium]